MSAMSEQLVEQLNNLDKQIKLDEANGVDVTELKLKRSELSTQLRGTLGALNEGKVLKG